MVVFVRCVLSRSVYESSSCRRLLLVWVVFGVVVWMLENTLTLTWPFFRLWVWVYEAFVWAERVLSLMMRWVLILMAMRMMSVVRMWIRIVSLTRVVPVQMSWVDWTMSLLLSISVVIGWMPRIQIVSGCPFRGLSLIRQGVSFLLLRA